MTRPNSIFITGIGTDVGKTMVSAFLCRFLVEHYKTKVNYWKPVQSGDCTDSLLVESLVNHQNLTICKEAYLLKAPVSPHRAAALEGISISMAEILKHAPVSNTPNHFNIVEGSGGLCVPINNNETIFDLIKALKIPIVLVTRHYLGSINHTCLSIEMLKHHKMPLLGVIFNGGEDQDLKRIIEQNYQVKVFGNLPTEEDVSPEIVEKWGKELLWPHDLWTGTSSIAHTSGTPSPKKKPLIIAPLLSSHEDPTYTQ